MIYSFLLRLVFSVNTLSPSSDNPQQFPLFFVFFLSGRSKNFPFHSFFFTIFFYTFPNLFRSVKEVLSRSCVKKEAEWGGGRERCILFSMIFSLWIDHWKMCVHVSWGGGVDSSLRLLNHSRIKTRERKKIHEGKKKDVKRNKNSEQIGVRWRGGREICLLFYCLCGMLYKRPISFTE